MISPSNHRQISDGEQEEDNQQIYFFSKGINEVGTMAWGMLVKNEAIPRETVGLIKAKA